MLEEGSSLLPSKLEDAHEEIKRLRAENFESRRKLMVNTVDQKTTEILDPINHYIGKIVSFINDEGEKVSLPSKPGSLIGFYFGGKWCKYCTRFSAELEVFLQDNKTRDFTVVYISTDKSKTDFDSFSTHKGFLRIPWEETEARKNLLQACDVYFFPSLVILNVVPSDPENELELEELEEEGGGGGGDTRKKPFVRLVTRLGASAIQSERFPGNAIGAWREGRSGYLPAWLERKRSLTFNPAGLLAWLVTTAAVLHFIFGWSLSDIIYLPMTPFHLLSTFFT